MGVSTHTSDEELVSGLEHLVALHRQQRERTFDDRTVVLGFGSAVLLLLLGFCIAIFGWAYIGPILTGCLLLVTCAGTLVAKDERLSESALWLYIGAWVAIVFAMSS